MDMRQDALLLAKRGLRVLPLHTPYWNDVRDEAFCSCGDMECKSQGKHPRTMHGVSDATDDISTVEYWWQRWPNANIGIATGFDFDVLDIDGTEAYNEFLCISNEDGIPSYVASVRTGRMDGWHYYCIPAGVKSTVLIKGLDVKGSGGYVVAPPSLHASGRRYEWQLSVMDEATVNGVDWPSWYADRARPDARPVERKTDELVIVQPRQWNVSSGKPFVDVVKERILTSIYGAGEGSRWQTLSTVGIMDCARLIKGNEMDELDAELLLQEVAQEIGLSQSEVGRVPQELRRALSNVHTPIVSRGQLGVGQPTQTAFSAASDALTAFTQVTEDGGRDLGADVLRLASLVDQQVFSMRAREIAIDQLRREKNANLQPVVIKRLHKTLQEPRVVIKYRIEQLWPIGGRVILAAQFKAGKTTLVGNLVRGLVDSGRFLNRYVCNGLAGTVGIIDTEMSTNQFSDWLRDQAISNTENVWHTNLRGQVSRFDITDPRVRTEWIELIKAENTEVLILDCLGPLLAACGLDENSNKDVGLFIAAFDELLNEAGVSEALIVHHMGHSGERSRGATRLRDWPDVEWQLLKSSQTPDESVVDDGLAPTDDRFFKARGRDVEVPEQLLTFDPAFRWLSVDGTVSNRVEVKGRRFRNSIMDILKANPGCSGIFIESAIKGRAQSIRDALKELVLSGEIVMVEGPKNAKHYYRKDYVSDVDTLENP